ncbi:MAG: hypothetical protein LBQ34_05445, partial [Alphaproteobacteria bacterium]|nr:hypothetical protein [Alphaproteobacteria bacterium]
MLKVNKYRATEEWLKKHILNVIIWLCATIFLFYLIESFLYHINFTQGEIFPFNTNMKDLIFSSDEISNTGKIDSKLNTGKSAILSYVGTILAGLVAIIAVSLAFKKYTQTEKQHKSTIKKLEEQLKTSEDQHKANLEEIERHNLDIFFKETVSLLCNDSAATRMGAVYTLIEIAKRDSKRYLDNINKILCQHLSDRSNIEYREYLKSNGVDENQARMLERDVLLRRFCILEKTNSYKPFCQLSREKNIDEIELKNYSALKKDHNVYKNILGKLKNFYSSDEIQDIIRLLFVYNDIFNKKGSNIYGAKLFNIWFHTNQQTNHSLQNIKFNYCFLNDVYMNVQYINNIVFEQTTVN